MCLALGARAFGECDAWAHYFVDNILSNWSIENVEEHWHIHIVCVAEHASFVHNFAHKRCNKIDHPLDSDRNLQRNGKKRKHEEKMLSKWLTNLKNKQIKCITKPDAMHCNKYVKWYEHVKGEKKTAIFFFSGFHLFSSSKYYQQYLINVRYILIQINLHIMLV